MAVSFPLTLAQSLDQLPIKSVTMKPIHNNEVSRTGKGEFITAHAGPTLWAGTVTLIKSYNADAREARALISVAEQYDASFFVTDPGYTGPRNDPRGAILGGATPRLAATPTNYRDIQIIGLPGGYTLAAGDMLSWPYATNPTRYAFHTVAFGKVANSNGTIASIEVTPMLNDGALVASSLIELVRPIMRAKIVPGSVRLGENHSVISENSSFEFQQIVGA